MIKTLYEIKHINVFTSDVHEYITFELLNGAHIVRMHSDYIDTNTGQVYTAVCDHDEKIIGFID